MIRACPRCRQTFEPARSGGVCPHCGYTGGISKLGIILLGVAALAALTVGAALLLGPLRPRGPVSPGTPVPAEIPETELPAAGASIRPPKNWVYYQRDDSSIAFKPYLAGAGLRFCAARATSGREAHLALIRERIPGAEIVDYALPEWPGSEALAVRLAGNPGIGASWLMPRKDGSLQVLYWGDEQHLADVPQFRAGMRFVETPPGK
jgi:hypothetical protein